MMGVTINQSNSGTDHNVSYSRLGNNIRRWRELAGLTQVELAALVGVSVRSVKRWEVGLCEPTGLYVAALCNVLGVEIQHLYGRSVMM